MKSFFSFMLFLPALALAACTATSPGETPSGNAASEIQGGAPESAYPAIGFLSIGCTGTLITPTVVLTAAHCAAAGTSSSFTMLVNGSQRAVAVAAQKGFPGQDFLRSTIAEWESAVTDAGAP